MAIAPTVAAQLRSGKITERAINPVKLPQQRTTDGLASLLEKQREAIDRESQRFVIVGDAEALHDLRVAMRRLHSLFVAFKPAFIPHAAFPFSLRQLLKQTNHARDIEVGLGILQNSHIELPWLEQLWQAELELEYARLRQLLPDTWGRLAPELDSPTTLFQAEQEEPRLGTLSASLLSRKTKKLHSERQQLCKNWCNKQAHALRITGKQIRYLLEPFADDIEDVREAVSQLKRFQDLLGEYHDIVVLRGKLKQLGKNADSVQKGALKAARRHLKQPRKKLRKRITRQYCATAGKRLDDILAQSAQLLA